MNIQDLRDGDRILVNGLKKNGNLTFLSAAIIFFMKLYAKRFKKDTKYVFSHAMTVIRLNNRIRVAESVENGFRIRPYEDHYSWEHGEYIVIRPKKPYTKVEQYMIAETILDLQACSNFYQYWGFLQWICYIIFGINLFGKGNKFSTYCYESTYRIAKEARPNSFPLKPEVITCFDLIGKDDEVIYDHRRKD